MEEIKYQKTMKKKKKRKYTHKTKISMTTLRKQINIKRKIGDNKNETNETRMTKTKRKQKQVRRTRNIKGIKNEVPKWKMWFDIFVNKKGGRKEERNVK